MREILFRAKRKGVIDGDCYRSKYKNGDWVSSDRQKKFGYINLSLIGETIKEIK